METKKVEVVTEAGTWFIALGLAKGGGGAWGRGTTEEEAVKQFKKAGGSTTRIIVYRNDKPELSAEQVKYCEEDGSTGLPYVDGMGSIAFFGQNTKVATIVRGKRTVEAAT